MGESAQIVNLKPPMAQNLQNSIKWTKFEPPRAHKFFKFNARTDAEQNGLEFDRHRSNLRKLDRLRLIHNRQDSNSIFTTNLSRIPGFFAIPHSDLSWSTN